MEAINEAVRKRIQSSVDFEMSYLEEHVIRAISFIQTSTVLQQDTDARELSSSLEKLASQVSQFKNKKVI